MKDTPHTMSLSQSLLDIASAADPAVGRVLGRYGTEPVSRVLSGLARPGEAGVQSREDLWHIVGDRVTAVYGADRARHVVNELRSHPVLLTANHYGMDTLADSVQGTVLFALQPHADGTPRRNVVMLGCGSVSLNNLTYPMGLLLYDAPAGTAEVPQRLPIFPNRLRNHAAGRVQPFDTGMVDRARTRLTGMAESGRLSQHGARVARFVLDEIVGDDDTLSAPDYGRQSARVNSALWGSVFPGNMPPAAHVQLQLEDVCAALAVKDLQDPAALLHRLMFTPTVRSTLLGGLDGARACWRLTELRARLRRSSDLGLGDEGTAFFWAMTDYGRRVPLVLEERSGGMWLAGVDERGERWEFPFAPEPVAAAVGAGQLVPSLFVCFTVLVFARAVVCVGGHYQARYLPMMRDGVVAALNEEDATLAGQLVRLPVDRCLAGLQFAVTTGADGLALPAGAVEIAGHGGFTQADLDRAPSVTTRDAHLAAFVEYFRSLVPDAPLPGDWAARLAADNAAGDSPLIAFRRAP
uniref:Uncharacterized protein n=1 Tax=Streptomyces sp. NBC_00008 TaxID=2903610 RepID=A0AAU2VKU4_9ACTN